MFYHKIYGDETSEIQPHPLMKKGYSSHQINIINQTFVFGFQFYESTNIPSLLLKLLTVVPQWSHKARSRQFFTVLRQWFVLMMMQSVIIIIEMLLVQ